MYVYIYIYIYIYTAACNKFYPKCPGAFLNLFPP